MMRDMKGKTALIIAAAAVIIGLLLWLLVIQRAVNESRRPSKAAGKPLSLSFFPPGARVQAGEEIKIYVHAKASQTLVIRGYNVELSFDPSKLRFKNISYYIGAISAGLGQTNADTTVINQNGKIRITGESNTSAGFVLSANYETNVAAVTFTVLDASPTYISYIKNNQSPKYYSMDGDYSIQEISSDISSDFPVNQTASSSSSAGDSSVSSASTSSVASQSESSTSIVSSTSQAQSSSSSSSATAGLSGQSMITETQSVNVTLNIKLKLQGVVSAPAVKDPIPIKVRLASRQPGYDSNSTVNFSPQSDGTWTGTARFANINSNTGYILFIKGPKHLQRKICEIASTGSAEDHSRCGGYGLTLKPGDNTIDMTNILMLAGDLPEYGIQNGIIDSYDVSFMRQHLQSQQAADLAVADLNYDGIIDNQDLSLVMTSILTKYDEE